MALGRLGPEDQGFEVLGDLVRLCFKGKEQSFFISYCLSGLLQWQWADKHRQPLLVQALQFLRLW